MITFRIPDMTCGHCASTITRAVASVDKGAQVEVSIPQKLVRVVSALPANELARAIQEAGYTPEKPLSAAARPAAAAGGCCCRSARPAPVDTHPVRAAPRSSCCG